MNCIGIRSGESHARARLVPLSVNQSLTTRQRTVYHSFPIYEQSRFEVLEWHWRNNVPLHPVYVPEYHKDGTVAGYLRHLSCRVCIFSTDADLQAIHVHDRSAFDLVADLERMLNFTMRPVPAWCRS